MSLLASAFPASDRVCRLQERHQQKKTKKKLLPLVSGGWGGRDRPPPPLLVTSGVGLPSVYPVARGEPSVRPTPASPPLPPTFRLPPNPPFEMPTLTRVHACDAAAAPRGSPPPPLVAHLASCRSCSMPTAAAAARAKKKAGAGDPHVNAAGRGGRILARRHAGPVCAVDACSGPSKSRRAPLLLAHPPTATPAVVPPGREGIPQTAAALPTPNVCVASALQGLDVTVHPSTWPANCRHSDTCKGKRESRANDKRAASFSDHALPPTHI